MQPTMANVKGDGVPPPRRVPGDFGPDARVHGADPAVGTGRAATPQRPAVYLASDDPANVLVITEFESRDAATRFAADGLMAAFREAVLPCVEAMPAERDGYDLFYSATPDGPSVTFGQAT